ncbi:hypothetical protein KCP76_19215 [Salmonella enterica subsp. enterica serovar Weltevreden]|nr:hypothetical protein KCP76_19215 [Salmonella enterica subsp. enterica serovar Weltevreden]
MSSGASVPSSTERSGTGWKRYHQPRNVAAGKTAHRAPDAGADSFFLLQVINIRRLRRGKSSSISSDAPLAAGLWFKHYLICPRHGAAANGHAVSGITEKQFRRGARNTPPYP